MNVVVSSRALEDQVREARFWKKQDPDLPAQFFEELDATIEKIKAAPETNGYLNREWQIRRCLEQRFHTWIVYRYLRANDELQIIRIYNARMNPQEFLESLDEL